MSCLPPRWIAADGREVFVWLAVSNPYYTSPIVASLLNASYGVERKHIMDIFGKYYFAGYCGFWKVVKRNTDEDLRKYKK